MQHLDAQQETIKNTQSEITKTSQLLNSNIDNSNTNSNSNITKPLPSDYRYFKAYNLPTSSSDKDFSTTSTQKR